MEKQPTKDLAIKQLTVGLVAFPLRSRDLESGQILLGHFLETLTSISKEVTLITGNYFPKNKPGNLEIINIKSTGFDSYESESTFAKLRRFIRAEWGVSLELNKITTRVDIIILISGPGPILSPTILSKIRRKKILLMVIGSFSQGIKTTHTTPLKWPVLLLTWLVERVNYLLADKIGIAGADNQIQGMGLSRYKKKITPFLLSNHTDVQFFRIKRPLSDRENIVGYVGRLSAEKGVLEFCRAIPLIAARRNDVRFIIIGDGPLLGEMKGIINQANCIDLVDFIGWVPYKEIPDYLNTMKIHVLPSHTEALGAAGIESMACGTISITNSAGGLPDVVIDGKTGFLLRNNAPKTIAEKVIEVLSNPNLEDVQREARKYIEDRFVIDKVKTRWEHMLESM